MARLRQNLSDTVSHGFEVIGIENIGSFSLAEAYNRGARQAQGAFLCFVHEDIIFCDKEWDGPVLARFEQKPDLGLIGVAGSQLRPDLPIGPFLGLAERDRATYRQPGPDLKMVEQRCTLRPDECAVRVLDGLFLFARREVWERFPFDENVKGFHFYDVDFSFRAANHYRVEVAPGLMIEHLTISPRTEETRNESGYAGAWVEAALQYEPDRTGLHFDELPPNELRAVKRFWVQMICSPYCSFAQRWRFWRRMDLPLNQIFWGFPILAPRLFRSMQKVVHRRRMNRT